ncbi:MAG TPA: DUF4118 domain-containing protein [Fimbriimonadaceae bacterium]|nr:DUF4118 domain-containing protein [Fimbriimonadaceae bacterium]
MTWRERWWEFVDLSYEGLERFWRTLQFLWTWLKSKPSLLRYGSVAVSVLMGYALGVLFRGSVSPQTLLLLFLPGVLLGAVAGGMLAGTLSSLLGALVCQGYLIGPIRGSTPAPGDGLAILLYLIASAMILGLYRVQERQKQEIRSFADRLESRVRERTAELRAANEDLQGFCYSIAHDLRAPMRNLTSSTRMIIEDVGDKLEGDAKDNLLSLGASASRLSQLVDDLLAHARLTSAELKARRLNLSDLAEEVAQELLAEPWLCRVSIRIEPRIIVQGDRTLLKWLCET